MAKDQYFVGIDVGSSKIVVCVATVHDNETQIIALSSIGHNGVRKGVVSDIEETVSALSHGLEEAERIVGSPLTHAYISISGASIEAIPARGVIAVSKPTGEIDTNDVARVIDAARASTLPQNRELVHLFPIQYLIDGQIQERDPVGMNGVRLEVDSLVISSTAAAMRNLTKTVFQSGIEIDGVVYGPLATALALTTKKQRENGVVVVDIGAGSTDMAVYEESQLIHVASIPIGSNHITNDIAIGLRTNLDIAEAIKVKYGHAQPDKTRDGEQINLSAFDPAETERISRKHVSEIIEARTSEIFHLIKEELQKVGKDGLLPAGVIFTGGGSDLEGITEAAKETLRLPASIGYPVVPLSGMIDKIDSPIYATSVGLVLWAVEAAGDKSAPWRLDIGKFGGVVDRFRGIFKNFTN
ncbi:MAG: cell division protein FtsA [Patescibacteria group bacterium]